MNMRRDCSHTSNSLAVCRLAIFVMLLILGSCGTVLRAQTIRIKLVNGRNGRAMTGRCVNVWVGKERKSAMAIPTDKDGVAQLRLTDSDAKVATEKASKECGGFGVLDPAVKYEETLSVNVGYVLCVPRGSNYSWLAIMHFSTKKVLQSGVVSPNTCGKVSASPDPGQIVLFVRPLNWWETLKQ